VLDPPVERQTALKVVRATHLLVVHEFRRYVRLPIITEVRITAGQMTLRANSQEISAGGMSVNVPCMLPKEQAVSVTFTLPEVLAPITVRASVCWTRPAEELLGIRFDSADEQRLQVKRWIDNYLDLG
jgi:c-di-GMP-binding flagellar brake protein YcgR